MFSKENVVHFEKQLKLLKCEHLLYLWPLDYG